VEEIKKREGFQLILEVSENGTEVVLSLGHVYCLILFFLANCHFVFVVYNLISFIYWRYTDMIEHTTGSVFPAIPLPIFLASGSVLPQGI